MKKSRSRDGRAARPAAAPAPPTGPGPWRYALAAVFVLLVVFTARYLSDADLGYHLRGGQWILEHHRFPSKDTYTYTRSNADYLDLHWLYQILIYATYVIGGYTALSLLNIVLVAAAFALAAKRVQMTGAPCGSARRCCWWRSWPARFAFR